MQRDTHRTCHICNIRPEETQQGPHTSSSCTSAPQVGERHSPRHRTPRGLSGAESKRRQRSARCTLCAASGSSLRGSSPCTKHARLLFARGSTWEGVCGSLAMMCKALFVTAGTEKEPGSSSCNLCVRLGFVSQCHTDLVCESHNIVSIQIPVTRCFTNLSNIPCASYLQL